MRIVLEEAALKSGRSLTQESELRMELGLRDQRSVLDVLDTVYGYQTAGLMRLIADLQDNVDWINDPGRFERTRRTVALIFEALAPGEPTEEQRVRAARAAIVPGSTPEENVRGYFTSKAFGPLTAPAPEFVRREVWPRLGDTAAMRAYHWAQGDRA
jgi:hypothetical protein